MSVSWEQPDDPIWAAHGCRPSRSRVTAAADDQPGLAACRLKFERLPPAPIRFKRLTQLFVKVFFLFFLYGFDNPKESVGFITDPGGEIEPVIEKKERPQAVKGQCIAPTILQRTKRRARVDVEGVDLPVSEIPDQQDVVEKVVKKVVTNLPKLMRYLCQAPW